jgi:flavin-dependent dehydrogenase
MFFEVVVIGSGPAGCAAALTCRLAGLETLIITKRKIDPEALIYENNPLESVHPGIKSALEKITAIHCLEIATKANYIGIQIGDMFTSLGETPGEGLWKGYHIDRTLFDAALLNTAMDQGVAILQDTSVTDIILKSNRVTGVTTSTSKPVHCRYLIDASGSSRISNRRLKFKDHCLSPILYSCTGVHTADNLAYIFREGYTRFIARPDGWDWMAQQSINSCTWTSLTIKGSKIVGPPAILKAANIPIASISNRQWRISRPTCSNGIILCGDAAGTLDPAAGQGILDALLFGSEAGRTAILCLNNPFHESSFLARYDEQFARRYYHKIGALKDQYAALGINIR